MRLVISDISIIYIYTYYLPLEEELYDIYQLVYNSIGK